jgi:hypothetical protein
MEVISFVLLAGATAALKGSKFAARLAKLFEVIQKEPAIQKIVEGASKLSKTKAAQVIMDKLGVVKDVGKVVIESKPARVVGKAVGTTARGAAAIAAAPGRGVLKVAEWIGKGLKRLIGKSARPAEELGGAAKATSGAAATGQTVAKGKKLPYKNLNPDATPDEIRVGTKLNEQLPETVSGAAETPGTGRSGDYRFQSPDGTVRSGDLYQPISDKNIALAIMDKSGQAEIAVVELGGGKTGALGAAEAAAIARDVVRTPNHSIKRMIFVKNGAIIYDTH